MGPACVPVVVVVVVGAVAGFGVVVVVVVGDLHAADDRFCSAARSQILLSTRLSNIIY